MANNLINQFIHFPSRWNISLKVIFYSYHDLCFVSSTWLSRICMVKSIFSTLLSLPGSNNFSYLFMNLIIITFVSVKAKFLPMQPLGPPLKAKEIVLWCCLHSYFSHLSGINSKGCSKTEGLWKEAIQFPVTKIPFFIGTPNIVISSSKLLSNSPPEEGNNLEV